MLKGSDKQVKFANDLLVKIEQEIQEVKNNSQVVKYFALQKAIESNFDYDEVETEECQSFIERTKGKINKQFNEVLIIVETEINNIKAKEFAGNIINDLKGKIFYNFFNHSVYNHINNGLWRYMECNKTQKSVLKDIKITASKEF